MSVIKPENVVSFSPGLFVKINRVAVPIGQQVVS